MRCLILGGDGMLGHQLLKSWQVRHDVRVTLHGPLSRYAQYGLFTAENSFDRCDVRDLHRVREILHRLRPEAVVNAVGIIKQQAAAKQALPSLEINAVFPHRLRVLCEEVGAKLIHVSTDCVFSGRRGGYTEDDRPDAEDVYGMTKFLGEVSEFPAITLRSSIIGLELGRKMSLIEWFLAQKGTIPGYTRAIYTGLTTCEMARVMERLLIEQPELAGVWQVASHPISKFELLSKLAGFLGRQDLRVIADDSFRCDRSLCGEALRRQTGYEAPTWDEMLTELANQIRTEGHWHAAA